MIIDCIADLHGYYPKLEGGDLLIVAGDLTKRDTKEDYAEFMKWLDPISFSYKKIMLIAGNHDNLVQEHGKSILPTFCNYLYDSGTEFEYTETALDCTLVFDRKLKIWGSPWTAAFPGMNPRCKAFTVDTEEELAEKWALIPNDTDILITHSPPYAMMDAVYDYEAGKIRNCGSKSLHERICKLNLKLHVFGHIHEGYFERKIGNCTFVNASHVNEHYQPVNKPIRIVL